MGVGRGASKWLRASLYSRLSDQSNTTPHSLSPRYQLQQIMNSTWDGGQEAVLNFVRCHYDCPQLGDAAFKQDELNLSTADVSLSNHLMPTEQDHKRSHYHNFHMPL